LILEDPSGNSFI
jgi:hypothetical protein